MDASIRIRRLDPDETRQAAPALGAVMKACVDGGASVSFMADLTLDQAIDFWRGVAEAGDGRAVLAAEDGEGALGMVQVVPAWAPNQPHRADIAKLMVHPRARGQGAAQALMAAAEQVAREMGRHVMTLDTEEGGAAERLYGKLGWVRVGVIPSYALTPDGRLTGSTFFYKVLD